MTDEQLRTFLTAGARTGHLATVRADGRPHVAPVWFILDGEDLVFMTGAGTVKGKNILRTGRAALSVDLSELPYAFATVEGPVSTSTDLDEMVPLSIRIAARYVPADQADAFGRRNAVEGELLVRLPLTNVVALDDLIG